MRSIKEIKCPINWIISEGQYRDIDISNIGMVKKTERVREYEISGLARYMLNPKPIEVEAKLIGCEIHNRPFSDKVKDSIKTILPQKLHGLFKESKIDSSILTAQFDHKVSILKNKKFEKYINSIYSLLQPYDPIIKKLSNIDTSNISNITGICEDIGRNRSHLNLNGSIEDKKNYINKFLMNDVKIIIKSPYISEGLFEMRGFDFLSYNPHKKYRLIKLFHEKNIKYCVLNSLNKAEFWIDDDNIIYCLHLLEHSIKTNPILNDSFNMCMAGNAKPLKIFFNKKIMVDYSNDNLPKIFKKVLKAKDVGLNEINAVMSSINSSQRVISFNYVPQSNVEEKKMITNISVLHDFNALEPIKNRLPWLYSEINKIAPVSDAGKYYLLDSIKGYNNE